MKLYIIFLIFCIIQTSLAEIDYNVCKDCEVIQGCYLRRKNKKIKKIPIFPPDKNNLTDVGKCICSAKNIETYKRCIPCYYNSIAKPNPPNNVMIDVECERVLEIPDDTTEENQAGDNANAAGNTGTEEATGANDLESTQPQDNSTELSNNPNANNGQNNVDGQNSDKKNGNEKGGSSNLIIYSIIGVVLAVGAIGFFVYNNKKKERPESMPFYGNSASPSKYSSLDLKNKNMSYISTHSYSNNIRYSSSAPNKNQYYQNNNYEYGQPPSYETVENSLYQTNDYKEDNYNNATTAATTNDMDALVVNNHDSVAYDTRRESTQQSNNEPSNDNVQPTGEIYNCTYPYEPKLDDELELKVNDEIQIIEEFEDGWMKAINLTTRKEGMAPIVCVKPTPN